VDSVSRAAVAAVVAVSVVAVLRGAGVVACAVFWLALQLSVLQLHVVTDAPVDGTVEQPFDSAVIEQERVYPVDEIPPTAETQQQTTITIIMIHDVLRQGPTNTYTHDLLGVCVAGVYVLSMCL
jgi:hypothetical protein